MDWTTSTNLKKPACASKQDVLELATLRYISHLAKKMNELLKLFGILLANCSTFVYVSNLGNRRFLDKYLLCTFDISYSRNKFMRLEADRLTLQNSHPLALTVLYLICKELLFT